MDDFAFCIKKIHEIAPEVKVTGALSNVSFNMPARKYVNAGCMTVAVEAGLDSAIMDPCSSFMMGTLYAAEALSQRDKGGRKYNRHSERESLNKTKEDICRKLYFYQIMFL